MLHEMAHLYNLVHGIKDNSNNGYYHNLKFKETAEAHGLIISKHPRYGWTITALRLDALEWIEEEFRDRKFSAARTRWGATPSASGSDATEGEEKRKKKSSSIKYVCPVCETSVRATKQVSLICGDCMTPMETEAAGD
jgi:hypothetical protein